jgi:hypothetical protein
MQISFASAAIQRLCKEDKPPPAHSQLNPSIACAINNLPMNSTNSVYSIPHEWQAVQSRPEMKSIKRDEVAS